MLSWLFWGTNNFLAKKVNIMLFWVDFPEEPTFFVAKKVYTMLFWVDFPKKQTIFWLKSIYYIILIWISWGTKNVFGQKMFIMLFWVDFPGKQHFLSKKVCIVSFLLEFPEEPTIFWLKSEYLVILSKLSWGTNIFLSKKV